MRIALHGPLYSGKTALARQLVSAHGFTLVNYTDYLKDLAARALSSINLPTTVAEIKAAKGKYRAFLQDLGTLAGFDDGGFVEDCLWEQAADDDNPCNLVENIVFDNVRRQAQINILRDYGFVMVRLDIPFYLQVNRGAEQGVSETAIVAAVNHPVEAQLPHQPGEISMMNNGEYSIEDIADHLVEIMRQEV